MSGALSLLSTGSQLFSIGQQALTVAGIQLPLFIRAQRSLGTIIPDVTVEEHHQDRMEITIHPIADGTPVSDHAFRQPSQVVVRMGWTNSNPVGAATSGAISGFASGGIGGAITGGASGALSAFTEGRVRDIYATLLSLQAGGTPGDPNPAPKPFQVTTGKRNYKNMMIADLTVTTDRHSEYSLIVEARLQEVLLVATQTTDTPGQANQDMPQKTADQSDTGTKQTKPPNGIGYNIYHGLPFGSSAAG